MEQMTELPHKELYKFYAAVMIIIFILALPLNASVLHLFIFKLKFWKSKSNHFFLFNLVLADILLLICVPVKVHNFIQEQRYTHMIISKAVLFTLFLNRGASIAFLTVISIDRYFKVVHPGRKGILKMLKKAPQISIMIWVLLLPLTIPSMLKSIHCSSLDSEKYTLITSYFRKTVIFTQIFIPFFILVYCTACIVKRLKTKTVGDEKKLKRAVFVVITVMVVFSFCFLPGAIARMVLVIIRVQEKSDTIQDKAGVAFDGFMVLSYIDCLLDPLVYCFCSSKFKELYLSSYFPFLLKGDLHAHSHSNAHTRSHNTNLLKHVHD
uniref:G-protein coupled receptors family 1 profile domain-containing protein n=1 Tax=Amphilophus citrinellus TaxID=61819 RepID=A0A3Q0QWI9_AMPCI